MQKHKRQQKPCESVIPAAYSGQIPVCLQCSGRNIRPHGIREGLWPGGGEGVAWVCDECGHIGQPLLVDPQDKEPSAKDEAWQSEYEATARRLGEETAQRDGRGTRNLGILFLVLAGIFFLPPIMLITNSLMTGQFGLIPAALGQSWIFVGIGTVALVLGVRKVEQAGKLDEDRPRRGPLDELEEAVEDKDQQS